MACSLTTNRSMPSLDRVAQVLNMAADQPATAAGISSSSSSSGSSISSSGSGSSHFSCLHLTEVNVSQDAAGSEAEVLHYLRPRGPLARLAARCQRVKLAYLDASKEVSTRAVCAVVQLLGLPEVLVLRHGRFRLRPAPLTSSLHEARCHDSTEAAMRALLPPLAAPLRLEAATPEAVLRDVVERLWLARVAPGAEADIVASGATNMEAILKMFHITETIVMLRGVAPPPGGLHPGRKAMAAWLDELCGVPAPAAAAAGRAADAGPSAAAADLDCELGDGTSTGLLRHLAFCTPGAIVPCASAALVPCCSTADAAALVAAVMAAPGAAGLATAEGAGGSCVLEAAALPPDRTEAMTTGLFSCAEEILQLSVLQVRVWK